ncbi:MAG: SDR family oxidoreductase, partial [Betaproteobacteria bacterium]
GRIINMSSVYGLFGTVNRVDYVTTKTALIGMTRAVALETLNQDITCNAICPGTALTAHAENLVQSLMTAEDLTRDIAVKKFLSTRQPAGRFVGPEGVAGLVVFLCGEDSGDITGSAISIDGGWAAS